MHTSFALAVATGVAVYYWTGNQAAGVSVWLGLTYVADVVGQAVHDYMVAAQSMRKKMDEHSAVVMGSAQIIVEAMNKDSSK